MNSLIYLATSLLVVAALLPLSRNPHWLVRGLDFPRMQLACTAVLLLMVQLFILDLALPATWFCIGFTALALGWQLCWVLPYTRLWKVEVRGSDNTSDERQISILTANVLTPNRRADQLLKLVRQHQPDVLVTLETDQWWEDQLEVLEAGMPHTIKCPLDNLYGMHVYSRLKLHESETVYLIEDDIPSMHALVALPDGERVRIHFLHPAPPSPTENPESAERDAELVIVARSVADSNQPTIVTGDLNDVAWSRTTRLFRKLSGLLDPRVGRGMFNTFHADYPLLRWPLDHLFHSDHFTLCSIKRLPSIGSDHFPLLTRLAFTPAKCSNQDSLSADADDQALASSIASGKNADKSDVPEPTPS